MIKNKTFVLKQYIFLGKSINHQIPSSLLVIYVQQKTAHNLQHVTIGIRFLFHLHPNRWSSHILETWTLQLFNHHDDITRRRFGCVASSSQQQR